MIYPAQEMENWLPVGSQKRTFVFHSYRGVT